MHKNQALLLLIILFLPVISNSQVRIIWEKSFGGSLSDKAADIELTNDSGYIVVGTSESSDGDKLKKSSTDDIWIVKIDSLGIIEWEKTYGGSGVDIAKSVLQTKKNEYIVLGNTSSHDSDIVGNHSIDMIGMNDIWVLKLDSVGDTIWKKCYGGSFYDEASEVILDDNGNFLIVGTTYSPDIDVKNFKGATDLWLLKIDSTGRILWSKTYGGKYQEQGLSIAKTNNGYVVTGSSTMIDGDVSSSSGNTDAWIIRLDYRGNIIWEKSVGGTNSEEAVSVFQDVKGDFYVACNSESTNGIITNPIGKTDCWILKLDSLGKILWQTSIGTKEKDEVFSICPAEDGGCIMAGYNSLVKNNILSDKNYLISKIDENGFIKWIDNIGGNDYDIATSIKILGNREYIVAGISNSDSGDVSNHHASSCASLPDFWVAKILDTCKTIYRIDTINACGAYTWIDGKTYLSSNNSATYTILNPKARDTIVSLFLIINKIDKSIKKEGLLLTSNESGAKYQWLECYNGYKPISGEIYQSFTAAKNGDYAVVINKNNCVDTSACISVNTVKRVDTVITCKAYTWIDGKTYLSSNNSAKYTILNPKACDTIVSLFLVIDKIDMSIRKEGLILTSYEPGAKYQWIECSNGYKPVSGEIYQSFTATNNGDYAVEINKYNCVDTSACVSVRTVGLEEKTAKQKNIIYPNPTTGEVNIEFGRIRNFNVKVLCLDGKLVFEKNNLSTANYQLNIDKPNGIYIIEITTEIDVQRYKILINK